MSRRTAGDISTPVVVNCTAGLVVADLRHGRRRRCRSAPTRSQAAVTEPVKPFLDTVVVSGTLHVYVSQTDRGELVFGASADPFASYSMRGSLAFTEELAGHVLELMPSLSKMRAAAPVGRAVRHDARLLARSWASRRSRGSWSTSAGARTGSRPARSPARRWPSRSPPARRPRSSPPSTWPGSPKGASSGEKGAAAVGPLSGVILVPCPWCGPRNVGGVPLRRRVVGRPDPATRPARGVAGLPLLHDNPAGWTTETWYHRAGCRRTSSSSATRDQRDRGPRGSPRAARQQEERATGGNVAGDGGGAIY